MWNIRNIMQIGVCSFCENIYQYDSLDEKEFENYVECFINEEFIEDCLERSTDGVIYDIENIENIYESNSNRYKKYNTEELKSICIKAFRRTIDEDKTINVEAFVENLIKEF